MQLWSTLERAAALHPRRLALVDGTQRWDYLELRRRCAARAALLRAHGLRAGDRVAILAWNGHAYLEAYYAAAGLGVVLCPLNVRLSARELVEVLHDSGARLLLAQAGLGDLARALWSARGALEHLLWLEDELELEPAAAFVPADVPAEALAQLYYTSGTTGRAKGVMLSQRNVGVHALATIAELGLCERDVWAHIAPMFHLADAWASFAITWAGGRHVMLPRFEAGAALDLIERERVTLTNLVPTMLNALVEHESARGRDYASLRRILSGGAPIAPRVVRKVVEIFGCEYVQTYGMTETSPYLTLSLLKESLRALPAEQRLAYACKTGRPFAAVELRVVDESGRDVPADERSVGEIWVRGETVTRGYWNQPEETRAAFVGDWLRTGDLAVLDAEGYVTIVDRRKDMILSGGENVYSSEVENVLFEHPSVLEAAAFGRADERWGERVCAAIVLRPGARASAEELIEFCRPQLASYKLPREIVFLSELPRTGSGKIAKRLLRSGASPEARTS